MGTTRVLTELDGGSYIARLVVSETATGKSLGLTLIIPSYFETDYIYMPTVELFMGTRAVEELLELLRENV